MNTSGRSTAIVATSSARVRVDVKMQNAGTTITPGMVKPISAVHKLFACSWNPPLGSLKKFSEFCQPPAQKQDPSRSDHSSAPKRGEQPTMCAFVSYSQMQTCFGNFQTF